jgi:diaminopimelate epimerase
MQGAGNDFVVLDGVRTPLQLDAATIRALADRHFGVGADQVLLVERPTVDGVDFRYRIFNHDGGEVEHCGNGARCFVKFVVDQGLTDKRQIRVQVQKGEITLYLRDTGEVAVDMGPPECRPSEVPFDATGLEGRVEGDDTLWPVEIRGAVRAFSVISMGNPHAVLRVDDVEAWPVHLDGPVIESHLCFPARVNAGFMEIVDRRTIRLRVYERGAGETLACGTGACAAAVAGIRQGLLDSPVKVQTHGGDLTIEWDGRRDPKASVTLTGPATTVFHGEIML